MAKVTYLDPNEDAPKVEWGGIKFVAHKAVDLDDTLHAALIEMAKTHPYFKVAAERRAAKEDPAESSTDEEPKPHGHGEDEGTPAEDEPPPRRRRKKDTW